MLISPKDKCRDEARWKNICRRDQEGRRELRRRDQEGRSLVYAFGS